MKLNGRTLKNLEVFKNEVPLFVLLSLYCYPKIFDPSRIVKYHILKIFFKPVSISVILNCYETYILYILFQFEAYLFGTINITYLS